MPQCLQSNNHMALHKLYYVIIIIIYPTARNSISIHLATAGTSVDTVHIISAYIIIIIIIITITIIFFRLLLLLLLEHFMHV